MVIQRIQSVYLLLVAILMAVYSFMNVVLVQSSVNPMEKLSLFDASTVSFMLSLLVAVLSAVTIFKYKKLNLQITLCSCNIILILGQLTVLVLEVIAKNYISIEFFISNTMPVISIILLALSIAGIRRDKKILGSYDRIR
ncbi:MAG: DUF4293 domain-containing protein [Muribaculaceae bacterium]|nr:DUF4293 domain-containing protein [Muribaculaceae bacterium]MEE1297827.1 DUF4293 domain-containing protein [Muribaculaceae bacterium]